jgi:hypothetical protein
MSRLEKKKCAVIMANILYEIYTETLNDFPMSFDDFGMKVTNKLYRQFKTLEGNQVIFDRATDCVSGPEQEVLRMTNTIDLYDEEEQKDEVMVNG